MAKRIVVGLDIGSQLIKVVVAQRTAEGWEVLGYGSNVSRGIRAGCVTDVDAAANAIGVAVLEAEQMCGSQFGEVRVSVSGVHLKGKNSLGVVSIANGEVMPRAERQVLEAAQAVPLPPEETILHTLCREYVVDGQGGVKDPVGLNGVRLEAHVHIISAADTMLRNLVKCCNRAGLSVRGLVASTLASAESVVDESEKTLGVAVIDLGCGAVDTAVYFGGSVVHSAVSNIAGLMVTHDLARVLETTLNDAERIKQSHGVALAGLATPGGTVEVEGLGGRSSRVVSTEIVGQIIQDRLEEILEAARDDLERSGYGEMLGSGIVLTGGLALLPGAVDLASEVFRMPARLGEPQDFTGLSDEIESPAWAVAAGLVVTEGQGGFSGSWKPEGKSRFGFGWIRKLWREMR